MHPASTRGPAVQEGSKFDGRRGGLGPDDITTLLLSESEAAAWSRSGSACALHGSKVHSEEIVPGGSHGPRLKMGGLVPVVVEREGAHAVDTMLPP